MQIKVYGLFDPRNPDEIMYVGATRNPLFKRLKEHIAGEKPGRLKTEWVSKLKSEGITPGIIELEECEDCEASFIEAKWIGNFTPPGHNRRITNRTLPHYKRGNHFLSERLKKWRGDQIQKTAADILSIPVSTYRNWEYGANVPGFIAMREIDRVIAEPIISYPQADKNIPEENQNPSWCDELRAWRKKLKISKKSHAAKILGVTKSVYCDWEDFSKVNHPDIGRCRKLIQEMTARGYI